MPDTQGRKVHYIDVSTLSTSEVKNLIEAFRLIFKYKLKCPRLMLALTQEMK